MSSDDDVIRKRLLIDGDGGGDERRLNALMKLFIKWCNAPDADHCTHQRMLSFLAQSEFAMTKTSLVHAMNVQQMEKYTQLRELIDANVRLAHREIAKCKQDLVEARLVRKHRQEYDALAGVVLEQPDRGETERQIGELDRELAEMTDTERKLIEKLNLRKKQFHALMTSIQQLQSMLKEEEDEDDEASRDDVDGMETGEG